MIFFIVNSVARGGRGLLVMEDVAAQLRARGIPFGVRLTEYAGHATELAREAALSGAERVVALGGDGTVREVAAGILESGKRAALGIIPCGTGNDYRRTLNIPDSPMAALELVLACGTRMVDAAQVNGFTYCNIASVGFDTSVVEAARSIRLGPLSYYAAVLRTLLWYRGMNVNITVDGAEHRQAMLLCAVGVGQRYGGGMKVLPDALPGDGALDYCLIDSIPRPKIAALFPQFPTGGHRKFPFVHLGRCQSLTVACDRPFSVQADGEILTGLTEARFTLLPSALAVIAPDEEGST